MSNLDTLMQRDPDDSFDTVLRTELRWEAPPELTNRLLALAANIDVTNEPRRRNLDILMQRDPDDSFDTVLRTELRWEAPPELTNRLLALAANIDATNSIAVNPIRISSTAPLPRPWYTWLIMILTAIGVGVSFAIAWHFYNVLGTELGVAATWGRIQLTTFTEMQRLYAAFPITQNIIALFIGIRDQLHWLLLAMVLWLALDGWSPNIQIQRQQPMA